MHMYNGALIIDGAVLLLLVVLCAVLTCLFWWLGASVSGLFFVLGWTFFVLGAWLLYSAFYVWPKSEGPIGLLLLVGGVVIAFGLFVAEEDLVRRKRRIGFQTKAHPKRD